MPPHNEEQTKRRLSASAIVGLHLVPLFASYVALTIRQAKLGFCMFSKINLTLHYENRLTFFPALSKHFRSVLFVYRDMANRSV